MGVAAGACHEAFEELVQRQLFGAVFGDGDDEVGFAVGEGLQFVVRLGDAAASMRLDFDAPAAFRLNVFEEDVVDEAGAHIAVGFVVAVAQHGLRGGAVQQSGGEAEGGEGVLEGHGGSGFRG